MKKVMEDIFLKLMLNSLKNNNELHNDLPFLPERMNIEKVEKLATNLHDKPEYVIHLRNLKQILNHGLVLQSVHRVTEFNQNAWLKSYIDMNKDLRIKAETDF